MLDVQIRNAVSWLIDGGDCSTATVKLSLVASKVEALQARLLEAGRLLEAAEQRLGTTAEAKDLSRQICHFLRPVTNPPVACKDALICEAGALDGVCCPDDSCDYEDGIRVRPKSGTEGCPHCKRAPGQLHRIDCPHSSREGGDTVELEKPGTEFCPFRGFSRARCRKATGHEGEHQVACGCSVPAPTLIEGSAPFCRYCFLPLTDEPVQVES